MILLIIWYSMVFNYFLSFGAKSQINIRFSGWANSNIEKKLTFWNAVDVKTKTLHICPISFDMYVYWYSHASCLKRLNRVNISDFIDMLKLTSIISTNELNQMFPNTTFHRNKFCLIKKSSMDYKNQNMMLEYPLVKSMQVDIFCLGAFLSLVQWVLDNELDIYLISYTSWLIPLVDVSEWNGILNNCEKILLIFALIGAD